MRHIPAFCQNPNCRLIFPSGITYGEYAVNVTVGPGVVTSCPRCESIGVVPQGKFKFWGDVVEIISAPHRTIQDLDKWVQILTKMQDEKWTSKNEIITKLNKIDSDLGKLVSAIPERNNNFIDNDNSIANMIAFLSLVVAIIGVIGQFYTGNEQENNTYIYNYYLNESIFNNSEMSKECGKSKVEIINNYQYDINGYGNYPARRQPCPCGSGKRYKNCCEKNKY